MSAIHSLTSDPSTPLYDGLLFFPSAAALLPAASGSNQASAPSTSVCWLIVKNLRVNLEKNQKPKKRVLWQNGILSGLWPKEAAPHVSPGWQHELLECTEHADGQQSRNKHPGYFAFFRWKLFQTWMNPRALGPLGNKTLAPWKSFFRLWKHKKNVSLK